MHCLLDVQCFVEEIKRDHDTCEKSIEFLAGALDDCDECIIGLLDSGDQCLNNEHGEKSNDGKADAREGSQHYRVW